jgi:vacuolar-type H+-ATPase subunit I/STV1
MYFLGCEPLPLFYRYGYVETTRFLMIMVVSITCGVVSITCGELRPVYRRVYMVGVRDKGYFYPT